jgi:hypothetical protein
LISCWVMAAVPSTVLVPPNGWIGARVRAVRIIARLARFNQSHQAPPKVRYVP